MPPAEVRDLLVSLGAGEIGHAGGSLLEHLGRTSDRLASWGADDGLQALGLAHAFYGTDGFGQQLLGLGQRDRLRAAAGPAVEAEVYRYASCGRDITYPHLSDRPAILFHDRFAGTSSLVEATELRPFAELTAANELDVVLHLDTAGPGHRTWLLDLVTQVRDLLTEAAWANCTDALA